MDDIVRRIIDKSERLSIPCSRICIGVSIEQQKLWVFENGKPLASYPVSTSVKPPSCVLDSGGTPTGLHRVEQRIGDGEKPGGVFFSRVSTGRPFWDFDDDIQERNLITSRILWLRGLEAGVNSGEGVDTFQRYIYIHGTNHEDRIGRPASGGCVVLANVEMIRLYDQVPGGSLVLIE